MSDANTNDSSLSRRNFLGGAALTSAGVAVGLSAYYTNWKEKGPDLSEYRREENQVRIGFIGVGNRGGSLLRTALQVPGAIPVAVADVQAAKRRGAAKDIKARMERKLGRKDFAVQEADDYRRLLDNKDVEAVVIATPHYLHGPMAIDAVEAGKHVYCEKAMAFTIGENQDLYNMVRRGDRKGADGTSDLVFQVGHQRHYSPLYNRVVDMIQDDHIGDIAAIRAQWNLNDEIRRPAADPAQEKIVNWRLYSEMSGGLTTEYATHQIDVVNWFLGTHPDSVCGYGGVDWYAEDGRDTHDNIHLIFNYKVPVVARDAYGRVKKDGDAAVYERDDKGQTKTRNVRFMYMSIMENAQLRASEMILGRYGSIAVSLAGGEFFKEKKSRQDPYRIAEGTNPARAKQKDILATGATVDPSTASLGGVRGDPISGDVMDEEGRDDRHHWTRFIEPIKGAYDKVETLLAMESFADCIKLSRQGKDFSGKLGADVEVGMWSAVPALMANIAMREQRTVYWDEFFGVV